MIALVLFLPIMLTIKAIKTKNLKWIFSAVCVWLFLFFVFFLPDGTSVFLSLSLAIVVTGFSFLIYSIIADHRENEKPTHNIEISKNPIPTIEQTQPRRYQPGILLAIEKTQPRRIPSHTELDQNVLLSSKPTEIYSNEFVRFSARISSSPANLRDLKGKSLMDLPNSYVVVDVETTGLNPNLDKLIELGAIRVKDGEIVDRYQQLINPGISIPKRITEINGITDSMVRDAPKIDSVINLYSEFIGNGVLVGHNVHFDVNFLYEAYVNCLNCPLTNDFIDTLRFARLLYRNFPNHKLPTVVSHLGIAETTEHRALSDAIYTHQIFQRMRTDIIDNAVYISNLDPSIKLISAKDISPSHDFFDITHPVYGKVFSFDGILDQMTRRQAMQAVADLGGINSDNMTKKVNYLVLGDNIVQNSEDGNRTYKENRAEILLQSGCDLHILRSHEFYSMIH
ncbi:MAG: exonuclease domain-containing protein [Flexilinea sp.]